MAEKNFDENQIAQDMESGRQRARLQQAKVAEPSKLEAEASKQSGKFLRIGWQHLPDSLGFSIFIVWAWYLGRWWFDIFRRNSVQPGGEWSSNSLSREARERLTKMRVPIENSGAGACCFGCLMIFILVATAFYIFLHPVDFGMQAIFG